MTPPGCERPGGVFFGLWLGTVPEGPPLNYEPSEPTRSERFWSVMKRLGPAGPFAVISAAMPGIFGSVVLAKLPTIGAWFRDHGQSGPVVAALAGAILGAGMLLPMYTFMAVCGWAFGPAVGIPTVLVGLTLGALINYGWARVVCRDRVTSIITDNPKWKLVYEELLFASKWRVFLLVALIRIPPGFPFSLTNFVMASIRVPLKILLPATVLGSIPRTLVVVFTAAKLSSLSEQDRLGPWTIVMAIVATVLMLVIISKVATRALARATSGPAVATPQPVTVLPPAVK